MTDFIKVANEIEFFLFLSLESSGAHPSNKTGDISAQNNNMSERI